MGIFDFLKSVISDFDTSHREAASALTGIEVKELENIFALLIMGSFVGLPAPPSFLAVELLPFMGRELEVLRSRAGDADDMLAQMFGAMGID